jgi:hypothetical protein
MSDQGNGGAIDMHSVRRRCRDRKRNLQTGYRAGTHRIDVLAKTLIWMPSAMWHFRCRCEGREETTVNVTIATETLLPPLVCAWCRRAGAGVRPDDPRAIVGLCDEHVSGFFDQVDRLLSTMERQAA